MTSPLQNTAAILVLSSMLACGEAGKVVDIGDDKISEMGAHLSDYTGIWEGYVEAFKFADGSDRVRLHFAQDGTGTLEVGDSEPVTVAREQAEWATSNQPIAGYTYPLVGGVVEDERIRAQVRLGQYLEDWCALFEPVLQVPATASGPMYACMAPHELEAAECLDDQPGSGLCVANACHANCACDAASCRPRGDSPDDSPNQIWGTSLDGALERDGDRLVGTLHLGLDRLTFRMMRQ